MNERRQRRGDREESSGPLELFSEKSEAIVIGTALQDANFFWECHKKLSIEHFTVPRLARIWEGMVKCAEKGRPPTRDWMTLYVTDIANPEHPLMFYINVLINDVNGDDGGLRSDADSHAEMVFNLAGARKVIDSAESAKQAVLKQLRKDIGSSPEHLQDLAMKTIATSIVQGFDSNVKTYDQWALEAFDAVAEVVRQGENSPGIGLRPGIRAVEDVMGRLMPGDLIVLAGMSGSGKSALVRQICENAMLQAADQGLGWGHVFSLEMTGRDYAMRRISYDLGLAFKQIRSGNVLPSMMEKFDRSARAMKKYQMIIDSTPGLTIDEIGSRMRSTKITKGLALAVIDHLIIMGAEKGESMFDKVTNATNKAKMLAKELNIPIILLAQLKEKEILASPSGWPNRSNLFGGETSVQNADAVIFVHRHELVLRKKEPRQDSGEQHDKWLGMLENARGKAHIFTDKLRGGDDSIKRELRFEGETMSFLDI